MRPRIEISVDEIVVRDAVLGEAEIPAFRAALEQRLTHLASGGGARPAPGGGLADQVADRTWAEIQRAAVSRAEVPRAEVSRAEVSWAEVSWAEVSWAEVSRAEVSWAEVSRAQRPEARR